MHTAADLAGLQRVAGAQPRHDRVAGLGRERAGIDLDEVGHGHDPILASIRAAASSCRPGISIQPMRLPG
jgi:hypothetical protein